MFGRKQKKNEYEMAMLKFDKAYNNMEKMIEKKTKELDKVIAIEKAKQNEMYAMLDRQMANMKKVHI